jgi:glycerate kinase
MRILAAFDKCKDSLSAEDLCTLVCKRIKKHSQDISVRSLPQTDGGEGFASILTLAKGGDMRTVQALDSLGRDRAVRLGLLDIESLSEEVISLLSLPAKGKIALIEMASVAGLAELKVAERNPWKTSTVGVGECLRECREWGVTAILLGIGGSSTNDMGLGALSSLGVRFLDEEKKSIDFPCPQTWGSIHSVDSSALLSFPPVKIACDVSNPLLGENGATFQFGPQKGLQWEDQETMEGKMAEMSQLMEQSFPDAKGKSDLPGMGAAGGIGFGLSRACEVSMIGGFSLVSKWFELETEIEESDLVLTGEGRFDETSLQGKGPCEILRMAMKQGKRCVLLAGSVQPDTVLRFREENPLAEIYAFGREELSLEENLANAEEFFLGKLDEVIGDLYLN